MYLICQKVDINTNCGISKKILYLVKSKQFGDINYTLYWLVIALTDTQYMKITIVFLLPSIKVPSLSG